MALFGEAVALSSSKKLQAVRNQTLESHQSSQCRTVAFHQDYREKETVDQVIVGGFFNSASSFSAESVHLNA